MKRMCVTVVALLLTLPLFAFELEVTEGTDHPWIVAVVPFDTPSGVADITPIVERDLANTGEFKTLSSDNMLSLPHTMEEVNFRDWRVLNVDYLVIGQVEATEDTMKVTFHVFEVGSSDQLGRRLGGGVITGTPTQSRSIAHMVSDKSYEEISNVPGAFSTKVMYILVEGRGTGFPIWRLEIADWDGANARTILRTETPIISPTWSPDGSKVAYVSYETGKPTIILHALVTGERETLADFDGTNSSPDFSPNGKQIAMTLSRDGNSEVYVMNIEDKSLRRITTHRGIDTEPTWTTDGSSLIFTSDRSGSPQIYSVDINRPTAKRLSFQGTYNARPRVLPDGKHMLFVHRLSSRYHIVWTAIDGSRDEIVLTNNVMDESPSVAPNGSMIIYASKIDGKGILGMVSIDGQVELRLPSAEGDIQEPAWSPYLSSSLKYQSI